MKLNPPAMILALVALTIGVLAHFHAGKEEDRQLACLVTVTALQLQIDEAGGKRPIIVMDSPDWILQEGRWTEDMSDYYTKGRRPIANMRLMRALAANGRVAPLLACPTARKIVGAPNIRFGDELAEQVRRRAFAQRPIPADYDSAILATSVAGISADRTRALIAVSTSYGPLGGTGELLEYVIVPSGAMTLHARYVTWQS